MLYIYKASAGAGKTHLLTGFFLQQLFNKPRLPREEDRPLLFNEILAVTFTNKATAEMKERIIDELHRLCTNPEKSDFLDQLLKNGEENTSLTLEEIQRKARAILTVMLNDYTELHVSTIDSFFQQVLRSFAHELNIQGNYEIELDADTVLNQVVSQFIVNLSPKKDNETFQWMLEFASKRIADGSSWNIHDELLKLAKVLTSESYKQNRLRIADFTQNKQDIKRYIEQMRAIQTDWKTALQEAGKQGLQILADNNLETSDFKGGLRSTMSCLLRWQKGEYLEPSNTLIEWSRDASEWYTKNCAAYGKLSATEETQLLEQLSRGIELITGKERICYESAKAISRNIYQLGILSRLEQEANRYCEEQGIQLLSNTTQVLSCLIQNESSPFIYEKTGTRIKSFMIDEFQDTSTMQWTNFKPLLDNSLGNGNENLVVGDVKQSIYRWRGSDWELLNSTIYDFCRELQEKDENGNQLKYNFRSDQKIIDFNNSFFAFAAQQLATATDDEVMHKIADIYSDVRQDIHEKRKEKINPGLLHYEVVESEEDEEPKEAILRRLPEIVMSLQERGHQAGNILILGRYNRECKLFAETLLNYKKEHPNCKYTFDIITDEALSLGNRDVIRTIVAMLHAIYEPKSVLQQTVAHCCYLKSFGMSMDQAISLHFSSNTSSEWQMPDIMRFSNQPLLEMVEELVSLLPDQQRESIFLQAFRDLILEHITRRGTDLGGFLKWWEEKGCTSSISTPTNQDAIRIMTIHQSKGLGEEAVIIPFADWKIDIDTSHGEILWLDPKELSYDPEKQMVVPIRLDASLPQTIFKEDYAQERMRAIIDNLNTAYVAFTRAKNSMVIMASAPKESSSKKKETKKSIPDLSQLMALFMKSWEGGTDALDAPEATDTEALTETAYNKQDISNVNKNILRPEQPKIKRSNGLVNDAETTRGTLIHDALSAVRYSDDIERPIRHLFRSGQLQVEEQELESLIAKVKELLSTPKAAPWFDRCNRVFNEQNIITHTTHTQRPDRIIITPGNRVFIVDYKTGKTRHSQHHNQVEHYMKLMRQMNFHDVVGYLWYVDQDRIEQVLPAAKENQLTFDFVE